jgi:uncharacterized membrane protein YphA (DoxX/SURF4 family)
MHPSRTVAICLFAAAISELAGLLVGTELQSNVTTTAQAFAAILILVVSLFGFFRHETNPIVDSYDWKSYLTIVGSVLWTIVSLIQLY